MKKKVKLNFEAILSAMKDFPKIARKYGLEPDNLTTKDLESLEINTMMDILEEYSNPKNRRNHLRLV